MGTCGNICVDAGVQKHDGRYLCRLSRILLRLSTGPYRDDYFNSLAQYDLHIVEWLDCLRQNGWTIRISQSRNFLFWNWELENGKCADPVIILPCPDIAMPLYRQQHFFAYLTGLRVLRHFRLKTAHNIAALPVSKNLFDAIGTRDTEAIAELVSAFLSAMANDLSRNVSFSGT